MEYGGRRILFDTGNDADIFEHNARVVCSCFAVGRSTLLRAIRGDRLVSVEQIGKVLNAGTNCGSCIPQRAARRIVERGADAKIEVYQYEFTRVSPWDSG